MELCEGEKNDDGGETMHLAGASTVTGEWFPLHVILGGWGSKACGDTIVGHAKEWLRTHSQELQDRVLKPYAPN